VRVVLDYFSQLFDIPPTGLLLVGEFDNSLVILSISIAVFASFMAFQVAVQASKSKSQLQRQAILLVSSTALSGGIWSMHFIGMLAFELCTDIRYGWQLTLLSLLPAILASWIAQNLIIKPAISAKELILGGVLVGAGIGTMHYIGMAAMEMAPLLRYDIAGFIISICVAVVLAILALYARFALNKIRQTNFSEIQKSAIAAIIMGMAISGMHYTGMAAARFVVPLGMELPKQSDDISYLLALYITGVTVVIIVLVLGVNAVLKYKGISRKALDNEKRLLAIMDTAVDCIITIDEAGTILSCNRAVESLLGWSIDELIGNNVNMLVPEPDKSQHENYINRYLKTKEAKIIGSDREVFAQTASGEVIPVRLGIGHIKVQKQDLFVAFIADLRQRIEMESALRENEARFRSLLSNIPGIAYRSLDTPDRPNVFISDEVENVTGYPAKDFTLPEPKRSLADFVVDEDMKEIEETDLHGPDGFKLEYKINDRYNKTKWMLGYGRYVKSEDGKENYIDGFIMDITQRKEMEHQLVIAKERAEQAAASRASFLANMSHEIRTPMNAIVGFSEILLESDLTKSQHKQINTINQSAKSLMHVLNDVLDSAKLEKGKFQLEYRDFSLVEEIDAVVSTLWLEAKKKNLVIILDIESEVQRNYCGVPDRLRQVLTNILGNAIKFTHEGLITVSVRRGSHELIEFSVNDTGIGMTTTQLSTVFEAFEQADESMSRRYGGTGLGTTISKQLVELMGGKISATSDINIGSTFTFEIPLTPIDKALQPVNTTDNIVLPNLHILIVDDIEQNLDLLTILLTRQGHRITTARDGEQALLRMQSESPDVVLLDIQMPVMDGLTAAKLRRKQERESGLARLPIVALTASVLERDRLSALEAGIDGFANKPVDLELLNWEIAKALKLDDISFENKSNKNRTNEKVNIKSGAALWGSKENYFEELKLFFSKWTNEIAKLQSTFQQSDWQALGAIAHGLKGLSGNLCLNHLMAAATNLETKTSVSRDQGKEVIHQAIVKVIDAARECEDYLIANTSYVKLQSHSSPNSMIVPAEKDVHKLISEIISLAEKNEINDELIEQISSLSQIDYPEVNTISNALNDFDFKLAITNAERILERMYGSK
jgi:PAS domain S-box-containing protein